MPDGEHGTARDLVLRHAETLVGPLRAKPARERTVSPTNLRLFIGNPRWRRWSKLLADCGLQKRPRLSHAECRRVLEAWYRELGEFRLKRRRP